MQIGECLPNMWIAFPCAFDHLIVSFLLSSLTFWFLFSTYFHTHTDINSFSDKLRVFLSLLNYSDIFAYSSVSNTTFPPFIMYCVYLTLLRLNIFICRLLVLVKYTCFSISFNIQLLVPYLLFVPSIQFLYNLNKFIVSFYFTIYFSHLLSSLGKSFYIHALPFLLFFSYIGQCLHFKGKVICVIYSINASYSSYANLKYIRLKLLLISNVNLFSSY